MWEVADVLLGTGVQEMLVRLSDCFKIQPRCVVGQVMVKVDAVGVATVNDEGGGSVAITGVAVDGVDCADS